MINSIENIDSPTFKFFYNLEDKGSSIFNESALSLIIRLVEQLD